MKTLVNIDLITKMKNMKLYPNTKNSNDTKIYKSFELKEGESIDTLLSKVLEEFPKTKLHYSYESLKQEVLKNNDVEEGNYISIPCFIGEVSLEDKALFDKEKEEKALMLEDYQTYTITNENYYNIACLYTNDNNEIVKLVALIQELNDYKTLQEGDIIKIPNIEKYKLMQTSYKK